jgi:hypothetical protein
MAKSELPDILTHRDKKTYPVNRHTGHTPTTKPDYRHNPISMSTGYVQIPGTGAYRISQKIRFSAKSGLPIDQINS